MNIKKTIKMENINDLALKLKNGVADNLMNSPRDIDAVYMCQGSKSYSRRDLANEIKNETELGMDLITNMITIVLDKTARDSF